MRFLSMLVFVFCCAMASFSALAGVSAAFQVKINYHVQVDKNTYLDFAQGSVAGASASDDDQQVIYCESHNDTTSPTGKRMSCWAVDSTGENTNSCNNVTLDFVKATQMVNETSNIWFGADPNTGLCKYLVITNGSDNLP